jgi:DNA-directed RNA polymerase subunit RPC12/RpoP
VPQAAPPIVPTPPPPLFIPEAGPPVDGTIYYRPVRCPQCGSKETVVTKKKKDSPIRYHRCEACKATFKSVET